MANGATLAQRRVLENDRLGLFPMALGAGLIQARHRESTRGFHDVQAVRIMALDATHLAFEDRMMLRKMEFSLFGQMTREAGVRVLARVDDEFSAATAQGHMLAPRAVASFAAALAGHLAILQMETGMGAGGKCPSDVGVTVLAGFIP